MGLAAVLIGLLLIILALVIWQHAKPAVSSGTYGVEDAVAYVLPRLSIETQSRLGEAGVRRILEWELFYLQGLAQENRLERVETVAGPFEPAVVFIQERISDVHARSYSQGDIAAVLEEQVAYLASIGAIGRQLEEPDK
jgi:hypothetical protein